MPPGELLLRAGRHRTRRHAGLPCETGDRHRQGDHQHAHECPSRSRAPARASRCPRPTPPADDEATTPTRSTERTSAGPDRSVDRAPARSVSAQAVQAQEPLQHGRVQEQHDSASEQPPGAVSRSGAGRGTCQKDGDQQAQPVTAAATRATARRRSGPGGSRSRPSGVTRISRTADPGRDRCCWPVGHRSARHRRPRRRPQPRRTVPVRANGAGRSIPCCRCRSRIP